MALLHTPLPPRPLTRHLTLHLPRTLASGDLTLPGATALTVAAGIVGAGLDTVHGAPAKLLFALLMASGAAVATAAARREHIVATVVMVPLAYALLLLLGGFSDSGEYRYWLATAFITKAPVVLIATAASAAVAVVRGLTRR
jgi:hypothetical protein